VANLECERGAAGKIEARELVQRTEERGCRISEYLAVQRSTPRSSDARRSERGLISLAGI
jgi:hypothetical protein